MTQHPAGPTPEERVAKAEKSLETAQWALDNNDYDSCVSRAYYAVFHACLALLLAYGRPLSLERGSWTTIFNEFVRFTTRENSWFREIRDRAGSRDLHSSLLRLVSVREDADYRVGSVNLETARVEIQFARQIVEAVKERLL